MNIDEDFSYLPELTEEIDTQLLEWLNTYNMHPLNLIAVVLARMTWLAKMCDVKEDFLRLLEEPSNLIDTGEELPNKKDLH